MKLKNPRTCHGCKAFISGKCEIGYKIKSEWNSKYAIEVNHRLVEPCMKPKTNMELINTGRYGLNRYKQ